MNLIAQSVAGDFMQDSADIRQLNKPVGTAIAKGLACFYNQTTNQIELAAAGTTVTGLLVIPCKPALASDTKVLCVVGGAVYVTFDGTVRPSRAVRISAATAGEFQEADVTTAAAYALHARYIGHTNGNERDGEVITDAVDGEVALIWINNVGGF